MGFSISISYYIIIRQLSSDIHGTKTNKDIAIKWININVMLDILPKGAKSTAAHRLEKREQLD